MNLNSNYKLIALSACIICTTPVNAEWIQSTGMSEKCVILGGACTARPGDFGAFYHNPASVADFSDVTFGANIQLMDTTNLELKDSAGEHKTTKTNAEGDIAAVATMAGYFKINDKINIGIGFGAPYALTADWENDSGIHRFNMTEEALLVLDLTPVISYKYNEKLSFGASLHIVAFKHLSFETLIPDSFGAALPPSLGGTGTVIPTTPNSSVIGSIYVSTGDDLEIGLPPNNLTAVFDEFAVTLGVKYQYNDRLALGASYRSKTKSNWEGELTLDFSSSGGPTQTVDFDLDFDLAAHLQAGFYYEVMAGELFWSFDIKRTFWSDATGVGSPAIFNFKSPLLGFVNSMEVDYSGNDTTAYKSGVEYIINNNWSVLAGVTLEEAVFDNSHVDVLTYDTDRTLLSLGFEYQSGKNNWIYTMGLQAYIYDDRKIEIGESQNLGGVSLPNLVDADTLGFSANRDEFEYGGTIWSLGLGLQKTW